MNKVVYVLLSLIVVALVLFGLHWQGFPNVGWLAVSAWWFMCGSIAGLCVIGAIKKSQGSA